jgi:hypothetical protein
MLCGQSALVAQKDGASHLRAKTGDVALMSQKSYIVYSERDKAT